MGKENKDPIIIEFRYRYLKEPQGCIPGLFDFLTSIGEWFDKPQTLQKDNAQTELEAKLEAELRSLIIEYYQNKETFGASTNLFSFEDLPQNLQKEFNLWQEFSDPFEMEIRYEQVLKLIEELRKSLEENPKSNAKITKIDPTTSQFVTITAMGLLHYELLKLESEALASMPNSESAAEHSNYYYMKSAKCLLLACICHYQNHGLSPSIEQDQQKIKDLLEAAGLPEVASGFEKELNQPKTGGSSSILRPFEKD